MSSNHKRWTPAQEQELIKLHAEGHTARDIAELLGRTTQAVHSRIHVVRRKTQTLHKKAEHVPVEIPNPEPTPESEPESIILPVAVGVSILANVMLVFIIIILLGA